MRTLLTSAALLVALSGVSAAQDSKQILALIDDLADGSKTSAAVEALVKTGEPAVKHLMGEALEGRDLAVRGWAIVAMTEIGGDAVKSAMQNLHADANQPILVRTWAAASRVQLAANVQEVSQLANLVQTFPALGRPLSMRLVEAKVEGSRVEVMLTISYRHPALSQSLVKPILAQGAGPLIKAMLESKDQQVRRQAAAYLGTLANRGEKIGALVAEVYAFDPNATQPTWEGGPLFLPALQPQWPKDDAIALTKNLVAWFLWADRHNRADLKQQIINNLQSVGLGWITGFRPNGHDPHAWIGPFAQAFGIGATERLLEAQGLRGDPQYLEALKAARQSSAPR